jgi:hypothetical protein
VACANAAEPASIAVMESATSAFRFINILLSDLPIEMNHRATASCGPVNIVIDAS